MKAQIEADEHREPLPFGAREQLVDAHDGVGDRLFDERMATLSQGGRQLLEMTVVRGRDHGDRGALERGVTARGELAAALHEQRSARRIRIEPEHVTAELE